MTALILPLAGALLLAAFVAAGVSAPIRGKIGWPIAWVSIGITIAILVLLPSGCSITPTPEPPPVPTEPCMAAQQRLAALGCPEAWTPEGDTFVDACLRAEKDGRNWCPLELAKVADCQDVEEASRRCGE